MKEYYKISWQRENVCRIDENRARERGLRD